MPSVDLWTPSFDALAKNLSCTGIDFQSRFACIKNASIETLYVAATLATTFNPVVHPGSYISTYPHDAVKAKRINYNVPFISGLVLDEGTTQYKFDPAVSDEQFFTGWLQTYQTKDLPTKLATMLELFPNDPALGSPYNTGNETFGLDPRY